MSFSYGITGDEIVTKFAGEVSLKYYSTLGANKSIFNTSASSERIRAGDSDKNWKFYGAGFLMLQALFNKLNLF